MARVSLAIAAYGAAMVSNKTDPEPYVLDPLCAWSYNGVVMGGADVVAYRSLPPEGKGVKGKAELATLYQGYVFFFANDTNRNAFLRSPDRYVPAWGGFCAWGIAREGLNANPSNETEPGYRWDGGSHMGPPCDPEDGWRVIGDTLYCSINRKWMNNFAALGPQGIADGNERWTRWYGGVNAGPYNTLCYGPFPYCPQRWTGCGNYTLFPNRTH